MKRSLQEVVELVVFGLIALLIGTGVLWLLGWVLGLAGLLFKVVAGLIWWLLRFIVPVAIVAGLVYFLVRLAQNQGKNQPEPVPAPATPATPGPSAPVDPVSGTTAANPTAPAPAAAGGATAAQPSQPAAGVDGAAATTATGTADTGAAHDGVTPADSANPFDADGHEAGVADGVADGDEAGVEDGDEDDDETRS